MDAVYATSVRLLAGQVWTIGVDTAAVPSILVTDPAGDEVTPTVVPDDQAYADYVWTVLVEAPGVYLASVTSTDGAQHFRATVGAYVGYPTLVDLRGDPDADPPTVGYLRETSWPDEQIQDALDAETSAQAGMCRIPPLYADDLRQALMRRVAVNLARRGLPLMVLRGDAEAGDTVPPSRDSEVRRLEGPYRKLTVG